MKFTLYIAGCVGNESNRRYPQKRVIEDPYATSEAVAYDHVCGEFKDFCRSNDNFLCSDVEVMDCDNGRSENPDDWISPENIADMLPDVSFVIVPSRHNMMTKGKSSARPRFHVYFPHDPVTNREECAALKKAIYEKLPFFDGKALDAARFVFGNPAKDIIWHEGELTIDCIVNSHSDIIPEGQRNSTMSRFAGRVLKRYGECDRAREIFDREAAKCSPPLGNEELETIWRSACKFLRKVQKQDGYISPERYNSDFGGVSLKPADYSDIGQAKILAREYGGEMKYTAATDYIRFDGQCWVESKQRAVGACEEFLDLQLEDAGDELARAKQALMSAGVAEENISAGGRKLEKQIDETQRKVYLEYLAALSYKAFVMKRRDMKYVASALQAAKPMLEIGVSELDSDGFLLNTPDGTYDLRLGVEGRREHSASDYITKITAAAPGDAGNEIWQNALDSFFCKDAALIEYVQKIVGTAAVGKVYIEALVIAYGEGKNGKSTFWNTIARVMGSYSGNMSADALTVGCKRNVKPELAEMKGKRLIIAAELEEGMRLNTSVVKQISSTDEIFAEKKYKDPFSFTPSHTTVLYTNHLPRVGAMDAGTWRRLIVIPFNAKIEGSGDVKNYADYLVSNAAPAVMKWIIEGAKKAIDSSFIITPPSCVESAIKMYREDNDWLGHFLDECCEVGSGFREKSGVLYQEYRNYCTRTGEYTRGTADFYSALELRGFIKQKLRSGITVIGLRIKQTDFLD